MVQQYAQRETTMDTLTNISVVPKLAIAYIIYLVTLFAYRLLFHPLSQFPGPKLAAITRLYEAYYDVVKNGQYTFKIAELHKKYGPIVRISPHELHVSDPAFYAELYSQEGRWDKYAWSYDAFSAKWSSICTVENDLHRRRRAPMNPFFSKATVASRQHIIRANLNKLCARIAKYDEEEKSLNLGTAISAFTGDVATEYVVGKSYDNLEREDFGRDMTNVLQSSGAIWRLTKNVRWLGPVMKALPLGFMEVVGDEGMRAFMAFLKVR